MVSVMWGVTSAMVNFTPWQPPLTPLTKSKRQRERPFLAPGWGNLDVWVAALRPWQTWPHHIASARLAQRQHRLQRRPLRPRWSLPVSYSTTHYRHVLHRLRQSSGNMTSTSLSSPPSIQRLIEDGSRLQLRTRAYRQWLAHHQPLERHRPHASHRLLMRH
jgi:hypothetical protein